MALVMCILGIFYIMQKADFLGIVQVFVYTGAVMMLFLFVLMLVGVDSSDSIVETIKGQRWASLLLVVGLAGLLFFSHRPGRPRRAERAGRHGQGRLDQRRHRATSPASPS